MSLLNNLVDSRRQRLAKLRSNNNKGDESLSSPNTIEHSNNDLLTKNIELEDNSIDIKNSSNTHVTDDGSQEEEDALNGQHVNVARDFELKLSPQFKVLESRTNLALKRILRRQMFQNDLHEEDINESDEV